MADNLGRDKQTIGQQSNLISNILTLRPSLPPSHQIRGGEETRVRTQTLTLTNPA